MSQYVQMNSIRGLFRAKDYCNYIREGNSDAFALENLICRGLHSMGLNSTAIFFGARFFKNRNREIVRKVSCGFFDDS